MRFRNALLVCSCLLLLAMARLNGQTIASALNAADYSNDITPGALISVFGKGFSQTQIGAPGLPLPTALGGVSVQVSDGSGTVSLPLYFVSPGQINAQMPYGVSGTLSLTVKTAAGETSPVAVKIVATAPKFFTMSEAGGGYIVATHGDFSLVSRTAPATPGESLLLFMNSLGAVNPPLTAGFAPGDGSTSNPANTAAAATSVQLDALASSVAYSGLAPGFPGLYQVNFTTPYDDKLGDAAIAVQTGGASTQSGVTIPVRANGLYFVVSAGKMVNGQTFNGAAGTNSALAFRHNNTQTFGPDGMNAWSKNTGLPASFQASAGLALTLWNDGTIVYDNNGIENAAAASYYSSSPGTAVLFSMSNLSSPSAPSNPLRGVYAGYFKLTEPVTLSKMSGYFEGPTNVNPPFNPSNLYNRFRMNIFSNSAGAPRETGSYLGDVFSSDPAGGAFTSSYTGLDRITSDGTHIPIYRLVYTLPAPLALAPGEYWFTHDVATPELSGDGKSSTAATANSRAISVRPSGSVKE